MNAKLAIITTHPIQYYAPFFRMLHQGGVNIRVYYSWGETSIQKFDPGFNKEISWDIPLLDGYPWEWAVNTARDPGTHHFGGIQTPGLTRQIEKWKPDVLMVYGWGFKGHLDALRHFSGRLPIWFRGDSTLLDATPGVKNAARTLFLRWVYRHVDIAFYPGVNTRAYFKKYGLKDHQLVFMPHAVDNDRFAVPGTAVREIRKQHQIDQDDFLILFAGKLNAKKSPLLLLLAFLELQLPKVHLLFVGNGPLEDELKRTARGKPRVHFMDFQNQHNMPTMYQACDIFCIPSSGPGETWGLVVNEAMASGKAILVSDKTGAAVDLVKPGENGEIFSAGSMPDMRLKLLKIIDKGKKGIETMGDCSQEIIAHYTFARQVELIKQLLDAQKYRR